MNFLSAVLIALLLSRALLSVNAADEIQCKHRVYERREHGIDMIPYLAYLEMDNQNARWLKPYHASGIIIDENMILTRAYHCEVSRASSFRVLTGETYIWPDNGRPYSFVAEYAVHPARQRRTLDDGNTIVNYKMLYDMDFCLLRLKDRIMMTSSRQMAPLPQAGDSFLTGNVLVSGWGPHHNAAYLQGRCRTKTRQYEHFRSPPFYHQIYPTDKSFCQETLGRAGITMTDNMFCLGYACKDMHTALGDDGGPVLSTIKQKVVGMVVNVRAFDDSKKPQLNLWLAPAVEWINTVRMEWANITDSALDEYDTDKGPVRNFTSPASV